MATSASTRGGSNFASPAVRQIVRRRINEIGGLALGLGGLVLLVALASYDPRDPSLDTATARAVTNMAGSAGAIVADLLLQPFGIAGGLPALTLLAWAWRVASQRGLTRPARRLLAVMAAVPLVAATIAALHVPGPQGPLLGPAGAGPGGAFGVALADATANLAGSVLGPIGKLLAGVAEAALAVPLIIVGLGLSRAEWRSAGQGAWHGAAGAARVSARRGRGLAVVLTAGGRLLRRLLVPPQRAEAVRIVPPAEQEPAEQDGTDRRGRFAFLLRATARREIDPGADPVPRSAPRAQPESVAQERDPSPRLVMEATPVGVARKPPAVRLAPPAKTTSRQESLPLVETGWKLPSLSLLATAPARASVGPNEESLQSNARLLESVLADYGVQGTIKEIRPGPVVTLYELEPAPGIRSARVIGLADDIARSLSVTAVRIATVPGRNVIGIELPNQKRDTVFLSELMGSEEWARNSGKLALALGKDIGGVPQIGDLARMPHLLVAGTTGSGKSVGINAMILSLLFRLSPEQCRLILIDPKMLELSVYEGIPHLMAPVVTEPAKAVTALKWTVREMERRYRAMSQLSVRNVGGYNDRVAEARARGEVVTRRVQTGFDSETGRPIFEEQPLALEPLPFIVVIIDEMADLMMVAGKEIEAAVQRLAQMARAAGIHVVMATQRPSVDVITGTIKANFPTRISFQVISKFDSRTILGEQGAEQLLGQGDMLYMVGGGRITRVHGPFVTDREVEDVVAFLRTQGEPAYLEEVTEPQDEESASPLSGIAGASDSEKSLFDQAVAIVAREGKASTSFIQRHLTIGYNRAAKLIEQMEKEGIISPANHVGKREILVRRVTDDD